MLSVPSSIRIYLARSPVDFRKAQDGLCSIVQHEFGRDPFRGDMFVFFNKRHDRVKILVWDANGFWLFYKRLEVGRFETWCTIDRAADHVVIDRAKLMMLLEGIDTRAARYRRYFAHSVRIGGDAKGRGNRKD